MGQYIVAQIQPVLPSLPDDLVGAIARWAMSLGAFQLRMVSRKWHEMFLEDLDARLAAIGALWPLDDAKAPTQTYLIKSHSGVVVLRITCPTHSIVICDEADAGCSGPFLTTRAHESVLELSIVHVALPLALAGAIYARPAKYEDMTRSGQLRALQVTSLVSHPASRKFEQPAICARRRADRLALARQWGPTCDNIVRKAMRGRSVTFTHCTKWGGTGP